MTKSGGWAERRIQKLKSLDLALLTSLIVVNLRSFSELSNRTANPRGLYENCKTRVCTVAQTLFLNVSAESKPSQAVA